MSYLDRSKISMKMFASFERKKTGVCDFISNMTALFSEDLVDSGVSFSVLGI